MVTTITARLRRRDPASNLDKNLTVLGTLLLQYLQELVKGVVRDFATPQAFHTVKVQRFKAKSVKLGAKFISKFPLPIKPLTRNLPVESCQSTGHTIPIARTFDFARECLIQGAEFLQGLLEKLRGVYLVPFVAGEECLVSIVKPCALTRLGFGFGIVNIFTRKVYPVVAAPVAFDGDRFNEAFEVAVFMERKPRPYAVDLDAVSLKCITCLRERHRVVFVARLDFRSTDFAFRESCFSVFDILKKCVLGFAIPQYNILHNLTRQVCPVRFRPLFEFGDMFVESRRRYVFTKQATIPARQQQDMQVDTPHIINHVAELDDVLLRLKFEAISFSHGISSIKSLSPLSGTADTLSSDNA